LFNISFDKTVSGEYVLARLPKKPGGNICKFCVDKPTRDEYVLDRPQKKPVGISSTIFLVLLMILCININCVEGSNL